MLVRGFVRHVYFALITNRTQTKFNVLLARKNNYHYSTNIDKQQFNMEKGNKMIASGFQTPQSPMARAIIEQSRSHGKTAELEKLKSQYCERICQNCKCMVSIREGYNAGKHQCVVVDPKNPHAPHVHFTMPHFKCSNNKFESKYGK